MTINSTHIEDQFQTLLETVERIRRERFQHIDAELVRSLLKLHADGVVADADVMRDVESEVEKMISGEN